MYALTPRLWDGDTQLRKQEPLSTALLEKSSLRESRRAAQDGGVIATLLEPLIENLLIDKSWVSSSTHVYMIMPDVANSFNAFETG
jgi:coenzyme F420-reducing hydrogenase beta subunit